MPSAQQEPIDGNPIIMTTGRTARDRVAEYVLMKAQGLKHGEIAERLGISPRTLTNIIYRANKEGWLKFSSPADRLEYEIAPKVVDNIAAFIEARDKKVTIEAAKGLGLFKTHSALKVEGEQAPVMIALRIDVKEPDQPRSSGTIVGVPKHAIDGEIVKPDQDS